MRGISQSHYFSPRAELVVVCRLCFGAVYQGVATTRGVSVACIRVNVIAIRCRSLPRRPCEVLVPNVVHHSLYTPITSVSLNPPAPRGWQAFPAPV
jgi:hypothetical protein